MYLCVVCFGRPHDLHGEAAPSNSVPGFVFTHLTAQQQTHHNPLCKIRLEHIWGPGDGRPVAELKVAIDQTVQVHRQLDNAFFMCICVRADCVYMSMGWGDGWGGGVGGGLWPSTRPCRSVNDSMLYTVVDFVQMIPSSHRFRPTETIALTRTQ